MTLRQYISIHSGGPGSGCKGPSCGRHATGVESLRHPGRKKNSAVFEKALQSPPQPDKTVEDMHDLLQQRGFTKIGSKGDKTIFEHSGRKIELHVGPNKEWHNKTYDTEKNGYSSLEDHLAINRIKP